ncbi:MAG: diacylglycerol/lipid kinase family protein [Eubacterium sp.]
MKNMLFVFNPKSGKVQIKNQLVDVLDIFVKAGYRIDVYPTQCQGDAMRQVMEYAADKDLIVCSGGDGTLNEVVSGIMEAELDIPIGYIPTGSTNDFAANYKIPKNIKRAADIAVNGIPFRTDIGVFNEKSYFNYVAAFGAFTDVSYATPQELKNMLGHQAYILEGIKSVSAIKPRHMIIEADTLDEPIEGNFIYGMITNSYSVAGLKYFTGKGVEFADGLLEVTFIREMKTGLDFQSAMSYFSGLTTSSEFVPAFKASKIKITASEEVPWTLDGEYGGSPKIINIEDKKQSLAIICPEKFLNHKTK